MPVVVEEVEELLLPMLLLWLEAMLETCLL